MRLDLPAIWPGRTSKGEIYLFKQDFERTDSVENDILVLGVNPNETIGTDDTKIPRKLPYRGFGSFIEVDYHLIRHGRIRVGARQRSKGREDLRWTGPRESNCRTVHF